MVGEKLCSLKDVVREVERIKKEEVERVRSMEARRRVSKSLTLITFYCPKCLRTYDYSNIELRAMARRGATPKCGYCGERLREVDEEFRERYAELWEGYRVKVETILKSTWEVLRNWRAETNTEVMPCIIRRDFVTINLDYPSYLKVCIEGSEVKAYMFLHWLEPRQVPGLLHIVETLKNTKVKTLIEVDPDHCRIPREAMEKLGFKRDLLTWQLKIEEEGG
jgi:NAD-dependent SIR2 family protein deacetylase